MISVGNPNQLWTYDEPANFEFGTGNVQTVMSGGEILKTFYPHWSHLMFERGKLPLVTEKNCIEDWIVVNWAYPYV